MRARLMVEETYVIVVKTHLVEMKLSRQQSKSRGGAAKSNKSQDDVDKVSSRQLPLEREGEKRRRRPWCERPDERRGSLRQAVDGAEGIIRRRALDNEHVYRPCDGH